MHQPDSLFTRFEPAIDTRTLPEKFTFPFYYQPHPLCVAAATQLQQHLMSQTQWQHDFGVSPNGALKSDSAAVQHSSGKMFGVLLVRSPQGEIGFFSAFSGKIADQNLLPGFVPPVFDMLAEESFFRRELAQITDINAQVTAWEQNHDLTPLIEALTTLNQTFATEEHALRQTMITRRAERKAERHTLQSEPHCAEQQARLDELAKQSVADKNRLKYLKLEWEEKATALQRRIDEQQAQLDALKQKRKTLSNQLQHKLFDHYQFLNARGESRSLNAIFAPTTTPTPPAGAGECAAPKLLHYAYQHGYTPLAMAEFWWGVSPKSEIRQHRHFYPSCNSKCQPILGHMLQGLEVDDNPLEQNWAEHLPLDIIYEDDAMVVVNKPSGLLSVPGKTITDSAYTRLIERYPECEGPFVIHRLDMATSGLLVFALTRRANKSLQKQFISRQVQKRYIALLDGQVPGKEGEISLPLRGDPEDRPRQLVCFEHGKPALTHWQLIEQRDGRSKLRLYPRTGRTHQLRVHCAHHLGLAIPIVGDALYGHKADRLHLHAERLEFEHPYTKEPLVFEAPCAF